MTVWNPLREMENIFDRYSHAVGRGRSDDADTDLGFAQWSPSVDIEESDESYLVHADLPGVAKKDIHVHLDHGVLSISGEKRVENESGKGTTQHRTERFRGSFLRRFTLPSAIKQDKVGASYRDGVLSLLIPKADEDKPRSIEIKIG